MYTINSVPIPHLLDLRFDEAWFGARINLYLVQEVLYLESKAKKSYESLTGITVCDVVISPNENWIAVRTTDSRLLMIAFCDSTYKVQYAQHYSETEFVWPVSLSSGEQQVSLVSYAKTADQFLFYKLSTHRESTPRSLPEPSRFLAFEPMQHVCLLSEWRIALISRGNAIYVVPRPESALTLLPRPATPLYQLAGRRLPNINPPIIHENSLFIICWVGQQIIVFNKNALHLFLVLPDYRRQYHHITTLKIDHDKQIAQIAFIDFKSKYIDYLDFSLQADGTIKLAHFYARNPYRINTLIISDTPCFPQPNLFLELPVTHMPRVHFSAGAWVTFNIENYLTLLRKSSQKLPVALTKHDYTTYYKEPLKHALSFLKDHSGLEDMLLGYYPKINNFQLKEIYVQSIFIESSMLVVELLLLDSDIPDGLLAVQRYPQLGTIIYAQFKLDPYTFDIDKLLPKLTFTKFFSSDFAQVVQHYHFAIPQWHN